MQDLLKHISESQIFKHIRGFIIDVLHHYVEDNPYVYEIFLLITMMCLMFYYVGKRRQTKNLLHDLQKKISYAESQKMMLESKLKQSQGSVKFINRIIWYYRILVVILVSVFIYFKDTTMASLDQIYLEFFIVGFISLVVLLHMLKFYFEWRQRNIKETLLHFNLEKGEIAQKIIQAIGQKLTDILRKYLIEEQKAIFAQQRNQDAQNIIQETQKEFEKKTIGLQQKIQVLEQQNRQLILNLQAKQQTVSQSQQEGPRMSPKISQNTIDTDLINSKRLEWVTEEGQILRSFVQKVLHFDWSPECLELAPIDELDPVKRNVAEYMDFSKKLGMQFNEDLQKWKAKWENQQR